MSPFNWRKTQPQPSSFIAVSLFYRESSSFAHVKWVKTLCLTLALCVCSISAFGESTMVDTKQAKTYSFDIPILRADVALIEFAEQAGRTLLFSFDETKLKTGNRLNGQYEIIEALDILLASTGLYISMGNEGQISIASKVELEEGKTVKRSKRNSIWGILATLFVGPALNAQERAETSPLSGYAIEEVIVTAQKREESLQDTPISIIALGSDALINQDIKSVLDLGDGGVPGVRMTAFSGTPAAYVVSIRGISPQDPSQISAESPTGIYVDGVYLGRASGLGSELLDLERVEVLRGPQGTLFGRNALGGAINMIAKKPTGEFGFEQTLTWGKFGNQEAITRINVPRTFGVSAKLDYLHSEDDGWVKNSAPSQQNWFASENEGFRVALLWDEIDNLTVEYAYDSSKSEATNNYWQMVELSDVSVPFPVDSVQQIETARVTNGRIGSYVKPAVSDVKGHTLNITYDISENQTLRLIGSDRELYQDKEDSWGGSFYRPEALAAAYDNEDLALFGRLSFGETIQDQSSLELQWLGNTDSLKWVLGLYSFKEDAYQGSSSGFGNQLKDGVVTLISPKPSLRIPAKRSAEISVDSKAIFGQVTWTPSALDDRLHITLGARHTKDKKNGSQLTPAVTPFLYDAERTDPAVVVAYDINEGTNAYFKWGTAYRGGGGNERSTRFAPYEADEVNAHEFGIKSDLWDRRLRINTAIFHTVWSNQQIDMVVDKENPSNTDTINAESDVTYKGAEIDITLAPSRALTLNLNYAYLDVFYPDQYNSITGSIEQFAPIYAPKTSAYLSANYKFEQTSVGTPSAYIGMRYASEFAVWASEPEGLTEKQNIVDARVSLDDISLGGSDMGNLRISAWVKNLTNESHITYKIKTLDSSVLIKADTVAFNRPRSYGVDVTFSF